MSAEPVLDDNKVYVSDISKEATEEEIKELFARAGDVTDFIVRDCRESAQKFAFVGYTNRADFEAALKFDGTVLGGAPIKVAPKQTRACFYCKKSGHVAAKCPEKPKAVSDRSCYKCGKLGHISRDCTGERSDNRDVRRRDRDDSRDARKRDRSRGRRDSRDKKKRDDSRDGRDKKKRDDSRDKRRKRDDSRDDNKRKRDDSRDKKRRL